MFINIFLGYILRSQIYILFTPAPNQFNPGEFGGLVMEHRT